MTDSKTNERHIPHLPPEAFSEMECKFLNEHDTFVPGPTNNGGDCKRLSRTK